MIDNWFKQDINKILEEKSIVVFIDESKEALFLIDDIDQDLITYKVSSDIEELKAKYEIEKSSTADKFLIYSTRSKDKLKFVREYCETNGCVEIKYFEHYIKKKVNEHLNLNINLPKEELISAGKVSVGKDQTYWMDLSHKGASEIFDLEKELLPFLDNPKSFVEKYDKSTQEIFFKKVADLIGQAYISKPAKTLAIEVANYMFDGLAANDLPDIVLSVYKTWVDSLSYEKSFRNYLGKYKPGTKVDVFNVNPSHPFEKIDEKWFKEIGENLHDKEYILRVLPKVNQRSGNRIANRLGVTFWKDVKAILEFDEKNINQISSHEEATQFYIRHFYKLDGAIRKLYTKFLDQKDVIHPWQEFYKNFVTIYLDKWFKYSDDYQSNQTGKIQEILDKHKDKTAIVVGDGVSWEFSKDIITRLDNVDYEFTSDFIYAGLPSETEHNMSQLYVKTGEVLPTKKERELYLQRTNSEKEIEFIDLELVNETTDNTHYLICSYKDPDKLGETYQQKALKYFDEVATTFAKKINQLLLNGYKNVYLVTDHGYTLTGILENSDKITVDFSGAVNKSERYIRTKQQQNFDLAMLAEMELKYKEYDFCYFAKRLGPFKTPGVYGFSHGGLSPQETLIPYYRWTNNSKDNDVLNVHFSNKSDLVDVTGNLYSLRLKGSADSDSLFAERRKVFLMFFVDGKELNKSDIIMIEKGEIVKKEYQFDNNSKIEIKILDANTREQLDKVIVTQSSARDMGGLF